MDNLFRLLKGAKIKEVRPMTKEELKREGWPNTGDHGQVNLCIEIEDLDIVLYPSRDSEGNGPGVLFGYGYGDMFALSASEEEA